jgi:hypothetical protein
MRSGRLAAGLVVLVLAVGCNGGSDEPEGTPPPAGTGGAGEAPSESTDT